MIAPYGIILAGGQARRMGGGDKGLLPLGGGVVLDEVIARIAPQVAGLSLNANGDPARFAQFDLPVLPDPMDGFLGPLAGLLAGMDWAHEQGATDIVTIAADTPFFPADLVPQLQLGRDMNGAPVQFAATLAPERGVMAHPTFGLWPVSAAAKLRDALAGDVRKVLAFADQLKWNQVEFPLGADGFDPFFNINRPDDLARAEDALR